MKVILSVDPIKYPLTGIGRYTLELARHLASADALDEVRYFARGAFLDQLPTSNDYEKEPSQIGRRADRLKRLVAKAPFVLDIYRLLRAGKKVSALEGIDGHIFHGPNFYLPKFDGPTVVTIHDLSVFTMPHFHPRERVLHLSREIEGALRQATMIVTDSDYIKGEISQTLGISTDRIGVAKLACGDAFHQRAADEVNSLLARYGLSHQRYTLYAGTIEPRKNLGVLIDAYAQLPIATRTQYPLVLAGYKGWNNEAIMAKIARGQREGWLSYLGFVPDDALPILFAGARAFAFPSLYEGFGLPVLEALASGVPVVTSHRSSLPEVGGDAALYVEPDDIAGLTEALRQGLLDETWRQTAIERGLSQAQSFSWQQCAEDTIAVYRKALDAPA